MGVQIRTREGSILSGKLPAQDMPAHVRRSIYLKRLSRGQHRYGVAAAWGVLDGVHIGAILLIVVYKLAFSFHCSQLFS